MPFFGLEKYFQSIGLKKKFASIDKTRIDWVAMTCTSKSGFHLTFDVLFLAPLVSQKATLKNMCVQAT